MLLAIKSKIIAVIQKIFRVGLSASQHQLTSKQNRTVAYLGNNKALTTTIYNQKIFVRTDDLSLSPHILMDGYWEDWITKVFMDNIKQGMTVLDIGANIGYYSLLAGKNVGFHGQLYSFEANPEVCELLHNNIEINGLLQNTTIVNKAVFSENGTITFNVFEKHQGSSSIFVDEKTASEFNDTLKKITVETITIDSLFKDKKVDFIKIDAEGAEPYILKGAENTLRKNDSIVLMMEWSPTLLDKPDYKLKDFFDYITSLEFDFFIINHDSTLKLSSFEDLIKITHCDVILKRPS